MWRSALLGVVLAGVVAGCGGSTGGGGAASCAAILPWQGRTYEGIGTAISPRHGAQLGSGQFPPCNDTPGSNEHSQQAAVYRIRGATPTRAVVTDAGVFVADPTRLPASVRALLHAPTCVGHPTSVVAVWGGVDSMHKPRFDGDIGQPPYRLEVFIKSGPQRLLRANLLVSVTDSTTGLLTPQDVKSVLWTGGTLELDLACSSRGGYQVVGIGQRLRG